MNTNNFDQSSNELNLELSCFNDTAFIKIDFDESFHVLKYASFGSPSILVYSNFGGYDVSDFDFTNLDNYDLKSGTIKSIKQWVNDNYCPLINLSDLNDESQYYFGVNFNKLNKLELIEFIENVTEESDYIEFLKDTFTPTFKEYEIKGYSQGDLSHVIVPEVVLKELNNIDDWIEDHLINLIYDAPVHCRLSVNDEECDLVECLTDEYNFDKDTILEDFHKLLMSETIENIETIKEFLKDNLPEHPDYY